MVSPRLKFPVDPQRLTGSGVGEGVADCLRSRRLLAEISALISLKPSRALERALLRRCRVLGRLRGKHEGPVDMSRDQAGRPETGERVRNAGTPVASLRHPPFIAKALHQRHPRFCNPVYLPPAFDRLLSKRQ